MLLASAERATGEQEWDASGEGESHRLAYQVNGFCFVLDITAAETTGGDWLDVWVQTKLDGENWVDVVAFTRVLGDGGALRYVARITAEVAEAEFLNAALGAPGPAVRNLLGDEWRVRWYLDRGCSPSCAFTFSVTAIPM